MKSEIKYGGDFLGAYSFAGGGGTDVTVADFDAVLSADKPSAAAVLHLWLPPGVFASTTGAAATIGSATANVIVEDMLTINNGQFLQTLTLSGAAGTVYATFSAIA